MKQTLSDQHLDFVIRTKKKLSYTSYWNLRLEWLTDDEIEKRDIYVWARKDNWGIYTRLYKEAKEKWFERSFSYFYKYRKQYIIDWKLNF